MPVVGRAERVGNRSTIVEVLRRVARLLAAPQRIPAEFQTERLELANGMLARSEAVWAPAWLYL